jgi:DNA-binding HxlR family transcriptional regulator
VEVDTLKLPKVRVEKRVIEEVRANAAVIFSLIKFANHPVNYGWLSKCTGLNRRTIQRHLRTLEDFGYIKRHNNQMQRLDIEVLKHTKPRKLHEYIYYQTTKGLTPTECLMKEACHRARANKETGERSADSYLDDIALLRSCDLRTLVRRVKKVWNVIKSDVDYVMPSFTGIKEVVPENDSVIVSDVKDYIDHTKMSEETLENCPTKECKNVSPENVIVSHLIDKELKDKDNIKDKSNLTDNYDCTNSVCAVSQVSTASEATTKDNTAFKEPVSPVLLQRQLAVYWRKLALSVGYGSVCGVDDIGESLYELQCKYGEDMLRKMLFEWFEGFYVAVRKPTGAKYGLRFFEVAEEIYKHVSEGIQVAVGE